jgi:hypothetical protein
MPSFTTRIPNIREIGPVVDIKLALSPALIDKLRENGETPPPPIQIKGLFDTGASLTVIQEGLSNKLKLQPIGIEKCQTASSNDFSCYKYNLSIIFPNNVVIEVNAIEMPLSGQNIQCLIGRDILSLGIFIYNGYIGEFSYSL